MFMGKDAVDAGLADRIGTFESELADLQSRPGSPRSTTTGGQSKMFTQEQLDAAKAEAKAAGKAEGVTEGTKAGTDAERARCVGILKLDEAKGREGQAAALIESGLSADAAKGVLAAAPKADAVPARTLGTGASTEPLSGADPAASEPGGKAAASRAGWKHATEAYNKRIAG